MSGRWPAPTRKGRLPGARSDVLSDALILPRAGHSSRSSSSATVRSPGAWVTTTSCSSATDLRCSSTVCASALRLLPITPPRAPGVRPGARRRRQATRRNAPASRSATTTALRPTRSRWVRWSKSNRSIRFPATRSSDGEMRRHRCAAGSRRSISAKRLDLGDLPTCELVGRGAFDRRIAGALAARLRGAVVRPEHEFSARR